MDTQYVYILRENPETYVIHREVSHTYRTVCGETIPPAEPLTEWRTPRVWPGSQHSTLPYGPRVSLCNRCRTAREIA